MDDDDLDHRRYPPELPAGTKLVYSGPESVRLRGHLLIEHPGIVASAAQKHADVRWADKQDWFVHLGVFDPRWLTVVDDDVFAARVAAFRASGWGGFPEAAPGHRRP